MKIMQAFDKKVKDTEYYRYRINLPKKAVYNSKLFGKKLIVSVKNNKIILEEKKN